MRALISLKPSFYRALSVIQSLAGLLYWTNPIFFAMNQSELVLVFVFWENIYVFIVWIWKYVGKGFWTDNKAHQMKHKSKRGQYPTVMEIGLTQQKGEENRPKRQKNIDKLPIGIGVSSESICTWGGCAQAHVRGTHARRKKRLGAPWSLARVTRRWACTQATIWESEPSSFSGGSPQDVITSNTLGTSWWRRARPAQAVRARGGKSPGCTNDVVVCDRWGVPRWWGASSVVLRRWRVGSAADFETLTGK